MGYRIIKGTEADFEQFGSKRFIAIITDNSAQHFAVRTLDMDKKQAIIHCNGGSGRFFDTYNQSIREYLGDEITVLAQREFY